MDLDLPNPRSTDTSAGASTTSNTASHIREPSPGGTPELNHESDTFIDDVSGSDPVDFVFSELDVEPSDLDNDSADSDSEPDGDPFEGRPDEIFWEDSDEEENGELGVDFGVAPWLQGLSAREKLEEVFNVDAAQRGVFTFLFKFICLLNGTQRT
jgi:hypothetical protein